MTNDLLSHRPVELPVRPIKHSSSYEDFRKQRLQQGGAPPTAGGGQGTGFGIRSKARSDPDISRQNLQKDLEVLHYQYSFAIVLCGHFTVQEPDIHVLVTMVIYMY